MDLYIDHAATTSRAVLAYCVHEKVPVNIRSMSLMDAEHHRPDFAGINPNMLVPVLDDGGFVLTEASAILRYLAAKHASPLYPTALQDRARVDERMAWFEANLAPDFAQQFVYPQLMPHHRRRSEEGTAAAVERGRERSRRWLEVLNTHYLATGKTFVAGSEITIADFLGASFLSLTHLVHCRLDDYPAVASWLSTMEQLAFPPEVNAGFMGFAESTAGMTLESL